MKTTVAGRYKMDENIPLIDVRMLRFPTRCGSACLVLGNTGTIRQTIFTTGFTAVNLTAFILFPVLVHFPAT
ncbi:hypothetical protein [uncultured Pontibacter sp.]|uniref:hypothetical protein n=1 Tax=uncultured Pontibacter sp. TaxID=453356 RepID=UPI00260849C8|nr:hypothetical protein [uncultured Pontibacter sp.]